MEEIEDVRLRSELMRVKSKCEVVGVVLTALMFVLALAWLVALVVSLMSFSGSDVASANTLAYVFVYGAMVMAAFLLFLKFFRGVVKRQEIFSNEQADRLRAISIVLLGLVLVEALFGFVDGAASQLAASSQVSYGIMVDSEMSVPTVNLNIGMLVFSAIMYSLSAIFRYAALLQQLSDETV